MNKIEFHSVFADELQDYLGYKRALGYKEVSHLGRMKRLDAFFNHIGLTEKVLTKEIWELWSTKRSWENESNRNHRKSEYVGFAQYLDSLKYKVFVPKYYFAPKPKYKAHIYTKEELRAFFQAADTLPCRSSSYRCLTASLVFRLLMCCGMRAGEVCHLQLKDVDLENGVLTILNAKNGKDRYVPLNNDLTARFRQYKDKVHSNSAPEDPFFQLKKGVGISQSSLYELFRKVLARAGISHGGKGVGPRVHDFRASWANYLLLKWIKNGENLMNKLPYMATMMGHDTFWETAYYITLFNAVHPVMEKALKEAFGEIILEEPEEIEEAVQEIDDEDFY